MDLNNIPSFNDTDQIAHDINYQVDYMNEDDMSNPDTTYIRLRDGAHLIDEYPELFKDFLNFKKAMLQELWINLELLDIGDSEKTVTTYWEDKCQALTQMIKDHLSPNEFQLPGHLEQRIGYMGREEQHQGYPNEFCGDYLFQTQDHH